MTVPSVTCNTDIIKEWSDVAQTIALGATATGSPTSWRWDMLSVPEGSTANVGVNGSFTDGVATIQNPSFDTTLKLDGCYVLQCLATNGEGQSISTIDKENGQQLVIVRTLGSQLQLPGKYAYDWGSYLVEKTIRELEKNVGFKDQAANYFGALPIKYYIDSSAGNNNNTGLSWGTAFKTLDYVWTFVLPTFVGRAYEVYFKGTLDDTGPLEGWFGTKIFGDAGSIIISGEPGYTTVGGTMTVASRAGGGDKTWGYVGISGVTWTLDEHAGKMFVMTGSGMEAAILTVAYNDANNLYFNGSFWWSYGYTTVQFVTPKSTYNGYLAFNNVDLTAYSSGLMLQWFNHTGSSIELNGATKYVLCGILSTGDVYGDGSYGTNGYASPFVKFASLLRGDAQVTMYYRPDCSIEGGVDSLNGHRISCEGLYAANNVSFYHAFISNCSNLCIKGEKLFLEGCQMSAGQYYSIKIVRITGAVLAGIQLVNCRDISIGEGVVINNTTGSGIKLYSSSLYIKKGSGTALAGTGNSEWGLVVDYDCRIRIASDTTPTITGTSGNTATKAGNSTWATIMAGTPLRDTNRFSHILRDGD